MEPFVKVPRSLYQNSDFTRLTAQARDVYCYLYTMAQYKTVILPEQYGNITLHEGELLTSYNTIRRALRMKDDESARRAVISLIKTGFITKKTTGRGSVVTIANWLSSEDGKTVSNRENNRLSNRAMNEAGKNNRESDRENTELETETATEFWESMLAKDENSVATEFSTFERDEEGTGKEAFSDETTEKATERATEFPPVKATTYKNNKNIRIQEQKNSEPGETRLSCISTTTTEEPIITSGYEVYRTSEEDVRQAAEEGVSLLNSFAGASYIASEEDVKKLQNAMSECNATKEEVLKAIQYKFDTSALKGEIKSMFFSPRMFFPKVGHYVNEMRGATNEHER